MNTTPWFDTFFFGYYPYICLTVFLLGSLIRFDRDQYTWKSDSSQMLRTGSLRWGSNLFHLGILFLLAGHGAGMLTPHFMYEPFISAGAKQILAMASGGAAGVLAFIGISLLLRRRLIEPRIRATSKFSDILILLLLILFLLIFVLLVFVLLILILIFILLIVLLFFFQLLFHHFIVVSGYLIGRILPQSLLEVSQRIFRPPLLVSNQAKLLIGVR